MASHNTDHSHHFIVPVHYYIGTFVSLLVLTFITVLVAQFNFGAANLVVAMIVAVIKAGLVVSFFMGMKWDKGFNRVAFLGSLVFLFIFFLLTFSDVLFRSYRSPLEATQHDIKSPVKKLLPGGEGHTPH
jgi:cytochrome c oxidase subunit 4